MGQVLSVPVFGGGVVLEGSSDAQRTDELAVCDGYDIGARGQLVAASDLSNVASVLDSGGAAMSHIWGLSPFSIPSAPQVVVVGDDGLNTIALRTLNAADGSSIDVRTIAVLLATLTNGLIVTFASFPNSFGSRALLVNIGARSFVYPKGAPGLYTILITAAGAFSIVSVSQIDGLGTGALSTEGTVGTHGKQLYFRGIVPYNSHLFGWGFSDGDATNGEGPNRLMFSNLSLPLKWGNDPGPSGTDRAYEDTDAIQIGALSSAIRAGYVWNGRLWIGCNDGLHYVEGFGRESFKTNGALPIAASKNVVGPYAMIEGPDRLLYGVGEEGLWQFNGSETMPIGNRLRNFGTKSNGYWDLIWTDTSRTLAAYPGRTNQDLVWMLADKEAMQVWVVIPYCSASNGYGFGADTVVLKYHCLTGGFTRQVFTGKILTAGTVFRREASALGRRFVTVPGAAQNLQAYGFKTTPATSPALPTALPDVTFGEYAPFGPDGVGVMRKRYVTIAWESGSALPLVFVLTPTIDGQTMTAVTLTIGASAPGAPANGDLWIDTSGTDTNLGNGTAGSIVPANAADFILKRYVTTWSGWRLVPGGGQQGTRVTIPLAFDARRGTRLKVRMQCTSAAGRWQIEGFSEKPGIVRDAI